MWCALEFVEARSSRHQQGRVPQLGSLFPCGGDLGEDGTEECGSAPAVSVGAANGLDHDSVINCDNIVTVPTSTLTRHMGYLLRQQEPELAQAIRAAFDLA